MVEQFTGDPVAGVSILIIGGTSSFGATTDNSGSYSLDVTIDQDKELVIIAGRSGYEPDTLRVFAQINSLVDVPLFKLNKKAGTGETSSKTAASIYLYSQSSQSIGVKESGSNETAQIIFEVLDSLGVAIGADNSVYG